MIMVVVEETAAMMMVRKVGVGYFFALLLFKMLFLLMVHSKQLFEDVNKTFLLCVFVKALILFEDQDI